MVIETAQRPDTRALLFAIGQMLAKAKRTDRDEAIDPDELKGEACGWIEARAAGRDKKGLSWEKAFRLCQMSRRNRLSDRPPEQISRLCGLREKATYLDLICEANFVFRSKTGLPGLF
jgi:hypothetical protein